MNWSPCSTSSQMSTPPPSPPNSALRAPHGMSGLFDTGFAGDAKLGALLAQSSELTSATTTTDLDLTSSLDTADLLFGALSPTTSVADLPVTDVDFLQEGNCGGIDLLSSITNIKSEHDRMTAAEGDDCVFYPNEAAVGFNEDSFLGAVDSSFLEQFTDLSSYSNDGMTGSQVAFDPEQFMMDMAAIEEEAVPMDTTAKIKRSASEAFDDATEETVVNPDHNDYTRKSAPVRPLKRARTATVTSESDAESVVSSTSSFAVVPSTSGASGAKDTNKYLERRRKNNIASRRSRETRKQKFASMDKQADELEEKNAKLRIRVAELEKLTKLMKDTLVQQLAGKATKS